VSISFTALGTTAVLVVTDSRRHAAARGALEEELERVDATCSRFRVDSELTRLNAASGARVQISPYLQAALRVALRSAAMTEGLVDPTIGRSLRLVGYNMTYDAVRARDARTFTPRFERAAGWKSVDLDATSRTVCVPQGVELDLGATAKAYAADRAARASAEAAGCGVLVALGGDVAVAGEPPAGGWPVGIGDDHSGPPRFTVSVRGGGLATSSVTVRRWHADDVDLHHIIDPHTGRPATTRWRTVTVSAGTCVDANTAATAALLLDDEAPNWLAERSLPSLLVAGDGTIERVAGWPE
jgi:thiamine biosynthesis lipoprotein